MVAPIAAIRYWEFSEVARLPLDEVRLLARAGDPPERVWAAWTLGLKLGRAAREDIASAFGKDPHPGVRSRLLVMLAGFGDIESLRRAALRDGAPGVRAAACQYLAHLAGAEDEGIYRLIADRMEGDPSPLVRAAAIVDLDRTAPPFIRDACERRTGDPDPRVRAAAAEKLSEWAKKSGGGPVPPPSSRGDGESISRCVNR